MATGNASKDVRHRVHIRNIEKIRQSSPKLDLENMKKSFLTLKRYTQDGQKVFHNTGISLQTVQTGNQFRHVLRIRSDALQECVGAEGILLDQIEMTQMYDIATATLDHEDVLDFTSELSRRHSEEMHMTALYWDSECNSSESCHLVEVTLQFQIAERCPSRLKCWTSLAIVTTHQEKHTDHIQSALSDDFIIALPNGKLCVGPVVYPNRAIFFRTAYVGFTSEVPLQYKVYPNMRRVHVHLFHQSHNAETSYISKGCSNEVILSSRKHPINDASLCEGDPRFFYRIDLEKTDLTVFMNTSMPDYYLAVAANGKDLQLEHIEKSEELLVGHTNAKFRII